MDGTFYLGDTLLPGALEFIDTCRARGLDYLFLTNNSSKHRGQYAEKLRRLGLEIGEEKIFTSGEATAIYLNKIKPGANIYLVGTPALADEFRSRGFNLVEDEPDYAVLGFDTTLTYAKLWRLCDLARAGKPYLATHPDFNCPLENGFMPDIGAMIAFVEASTGRRPDVVVGKPNRPIIEAVVEKTGVPIQQICMVGDRLYTDIALGATGITTVLVLSGEATLEDLPTAPHQPDFVMQDLAELGAALAVG
ncbi:MAG: HAD-IIA family hydrolase [Anaerolineae bacterium]|nr:HAD-IIA family hydrolase [Anaerolineae bacterium]